MSAVRFREVPQHLKRGAKIFSPLFFVRAFWVKLLYIEKFYIYVLRSVEYSKTYLGMSENVDKKLLEYNSGKTRSTKPFRPWKLIYTECTGKTAEARRKEKHYMLTAGKNFLRKRKNL